MGIWYDGGVKRLKRILQVLAALLLVLVLALAVFGYVSFGGLASNQDGQHVGATLEVVEDGYVAVDILDLGDGHVALIDCGNDRMGAAILAALARRDLGPDDVSDVFLTHGHPDHVAACPVFTHATIHALEADVALAAGTVAPPSPIGHLAPTRPTGVRVDHVLHDGDVVTRGNAEVRVYAVPGHTAGSAAYLVDGVLLVGDSASLTTDGRLVGAPWIFSDDQAENVRSMHALAERLAGETVTAIVTSHSGVASEGDLVALLRALGA